MSPKRGTIGHVLWFWVIVLVVLIGAIAVVAAGRGDAMADVYDDRPDSTLPAGRELTADDLRSVRLNTGVRGYRMDEVDALLARLEAEMIEREDREVRLLTRPAAPVESETVADEPALVESEGVPDEAELDDDGAVPDKVAPHDAVPDDAAPADDQVALDQAVPTDDQVPLHAGERRDEP